MKTKTLWTTVLALLLACMHVPAGAAEPGQLSMLVTGRVSIDADGAVTDYALDKPEALSGDIVGLVDASVRGWRFEPVIRDGKAAPESARMSLGLIAKKADDGRYRAAIRSANFSSDASAIASVRMTPPRYPVDAARAGVGGMVYVVVLIGADGGVERAAVEQVDLDRDGGESSRTGLRRTLADAALAAARQWTFEVPPAGSDVLARTVRVPTDFTLLDGGDEPPAYGRWKAYFPGPRVRVPWLKEATPADGAPIAAAAGAAQPVRPALVLKTPLGAS